MQEEERRKRGLAIWNHAEGMPVGMSVDDCTCLKCKVDDKQCEFAWDPYNTDGDCLASK
jgi:hypothetical protein